MKIGPIQDIRFLSEKCQESEQEKKLIEAAWTDWETICRKIAISVDL